MTDTRDLEFPSSDGEAELPQPVVSRILALYAATPQPAAGQVQRCVEAINVGIKRGMPRPYLLRTQWWWAAAAAAAVLIAVSLRSPFSSRGHGARDTVTVASATEVDSGHVQFMLHLPRGASKVSIVGDWNQWDSAATPMTRGSGQDAWSAKVALLPGRHIYAYVVNGERWLVDPLAPQADAGYGPANAVVVDGAF